MTTTTTTSDNAARSLIRWACVALIAVVLWRLAVVVPAWASGAPEPYPGKYIGRLYFAVTQVPLLCVTLIVLGARPGPVPLWRRVLPAVLLAISVAAMMLDARRD